MDGCQDHQIVRLGTRQTEAQSCLVVYSLMLNRPKTRRVGGKATNWTRIMRGTFSHQPMSECVAAALGSNAPRNPGSLQDERSVLPVSSRGGDPEISTDTHIRPDRFEPFFP